MSQLRGLRGVVWSASCATTLCLSACDRSSPRPNSAALAEQPSPTFRNIATPTAYAGDASCASCHAPETEAYRQFAMARSFHRWTPATRIETPMNRPLRQEQSGFSYTVVERAGALYQVEFLERPDGTRMQELERRVDYVMGSGAIARTYFTDENGRLFQLPLTWYRDHGWDFSPGYEVNNARFSRVMPDRCIACHSNYPEPTPFLEGKHAELRPGIGCERCHGPGALHVVERRRSASRDTGTAFDNTIVNPARLPLARRLDMCEQCHVHTSVNVFREGENAFSYLPSEPLRDHIAFFKEAGSIDIVSHADRLRQSQCFIATSRTTRPLECATCHDPHGNAAQAQARSTTCASCHTEAALQARLASSASRTDHVDGSDCARCHMPEVRERTVPHGTFTDHWIRVVEREPSRPRTARSERQRIEAYFDRDRTGPEAAIYRGMGEVVFANLANSRRALVDGVAHLSAALGADSTRADAHFLLGVGADQLGDTAAAVRALERSVRADATHPDRLRALARAYERAGRDDAAIDALYRRALALQPALAWIRADYADFLRARSRRGDARREYEAALREQPSLGVAWFNLGTLLTEQDDRAAAVDAFKEALQLDPTLAAAFSPLIEIRAADTGVTEARELEPPLPSFPIRQRGPRAVQLSLTRSPRPALTLVNVPPDGVVQVLLPDGTPVRSLATGDGFSTSWDFMTQRGRPVAGGLYRMLIQGRDASGRVLSQSLYFGLVRRD